MLKRLADLNSVLDRETLRVRRPNHIIFLCGGVIPKEVDSPLVSVRDYLYRVRKSERRVGGAFVLAETAQQLYRDTSYNDLISFEEDIAKIASIVLVICESPGSLAELGSFSSELGIRDTVRLILSEDHYNAESFVRFGPVKRIEDINRTRIGVFPWKYHKSTGRPIKSSLAPHYQEIINFIKGHVAHIPASSSYVGLEEKAVFFDLLWIISLLQSVPPEPLYEALRMIHPNYSDGEIKNKLYALRVCRWIGVFSYSGRDYYYIIEDFDPYDYAYLKNQRVRDVNAIKLEIVSEFRKAAGVTQAVTKRLLDQRVSK